jgi:hypothetical protein
MTGQAIRPSNDALFQSLMTLNQARRNQ